MGTLQLLAWCWPSVESQPFLQRTGTSVEQCAAELRFFLKRTFSCPRDVGGVNLFHSLVSKAVGHSGSVFKCVLCAGQWRCWNSCSWLGDSSCVKTGIVCHLGKLDWIVGCTWLLNLSIYSLAVIWPRYCSPNHHRSFPLSCFYYSRLTVLLM
jgi:hypothetical protein